MDNNSKTGKAVKTGISFGSCLAMVISYVNWHSVGWAILHGLMSWVYVSTTSSATEKFRKKENDL